MNKSGQFFPVRPGLAKRGQFYLITTMIILGIIVGFTTLSNYTQKKTPLKFYHAGEELEIESGKVLDYGINNDKDLGELLTTFTEDYSDYSDFDNFYFVFGNENTITLTGCKKLENGNMMVEDRLGMQLGSLNLVGGQCNPISSTSINDVPDDISLVIGDIKYPFTLKAGENFYFVISKETEGEVNVLTNPNA